MLDASEGATVRRPRRLLKEGFPNAKRFPWFNACGVSAARHLTRSAGSNLGEAGARSGNSDTGPVWKLGTAPPGTRHGGDRTLRDTGRLQRITWSSRGANSGE